MTKETKVWVASGREGDIWQVHYDKAYAEDVVKRLRENDSQIDYKLIELAPNSEPEKIKMTQAEWDEFNSVYERYNGFVDLYSAMHELVRHKNPQLFTRLFDNTPRNLNNTQSQLEFAQLWASDNPEELVKIEEETKYYLSLKINPNIVLADYGTYYRTYDFEQGMHKEFTKSEIDELGGDEWLAEMGLKKVEVTE